MKIRLETKVKGHYKEVMSKFDRKLFEALSPDIGKMKVVEFTGSQKGDRVHLKFISPFSAEWISEITKDGIDDERAYFIDEGRVLPFGLKQWRHKHIVEKVDEGVSRIIDDMEFEGKNRIHTLILYPILYAGFYPRKAKYQDYFGHPDD